MFEADVIILERLDELAIKKWLRTMRGTGQFKTSKVHIIFTSDDYLLAINRQFLNHDYYTDVVTFERKSYDSVQAEIYISVHRAEENAELWKVSLENEILRLIIHGMLHAEGMKDSTLEEKKLMTEKENWALREYSKVSRETIV